MKSQLLKHLKKDDKEFSATIKYTLDELLKYSMRPHLYSKQFKKMRCTTAPVRYGPYRIVTIDRKAKHSKSVLFNSTKIEYSRLDPELGSLVCIVLTINEMLNEYEIIAYNHTIDQWVRHKQHKLIPYESFK